MTALLVAAYAVGAVVSGAWLSAQRRIDQDAINSKRNADPRQMIDRFMSPGPAASVDPPEEAWGGPDIVAPMALFWPITVAMLVLKRRFYAAALRKRVEQLELEKLEREMNRILKEME